MPYRLRKAPKRELYWVVAQDGTKKSKDPIPLERAKAQMRALYASERQQKLRGGAMTQHQRQQILNHTTSVGNWDDVFELFDALFQLYQDDNDTTMRIAEEQADLQQMLENPMNLLQPELFAFNLRDFINDLPMEEEDERATIAEESKEERGEDTTDEEESDSDEEVRGRGKKKRGGMDRQPPRLAPCEGEAHTGECTLTAEEIAGLRDILENDDVSREDVVNVIRTLRPTLSNQLDRNLLEDAVSTLSNRTDRRSIQATINKIITILDRVFPSATGAGFFGDIWDASKALAKQAVSRVKQGLKDVSKGFRYDYEPKIRDLLQKIGNQPIVSMYVRREPIQAPINTALNYITKGKWEEVKKKYSYDQLFHLGLEVVVKLNDNGSKVGRYVIEKNEVINIQPAKAIQEDTDLMIVPMNSGATINSLLNNGKELMKEKWFPYHPFLNNCQDFILGVLKGSGFLTPQLTEFIKQDLSEAIKELPEYTGTLAKGITDLGGLFNVFLKGRGGLTPSKKFSKQLVKMGISPSTYLDEARKKAKKLGLQYQHLGFSEDDTHKLQIPNKNGKIIRFGSVGMGDYILYKLSGNHKADNHRALYRKRATKIKGDWADDEYSPNSLAIGVLW
jgi:hypothetical protein